MMSSNTVKQQFLWIDILRCVAILSVLLVHVTAPYLYSWTSPLSANWMIANLFNSFGRMGVPLFFLMSGYLLLGTDRTKNIKKFYFRRWQKIGLLWLGWGILHLLYLYFYRQLGWQWSMLITGFWFVPQILGVYFLAPYIDTWLKRTSSQRAWMLTIILFILGSLSVQLAVWMYHEPYLPYLHMVSYVGLFIAGALIKNIKDVSFTYLGLLWLLCYLVTVVGTTFTSSLRQGFNSAFYEYASFNVVGMSLAFFAVMTKQEVLFISWKKKWPLLKKVVTYIGKNSYFLFLSHTLVILMLTDYWSWWTQGFSYVVLIDVLTKVLILVGLSSLVVEAQKFVVKRVKVW